MALVEWAAQFDFHGVGADRRSGVVARCVALEAECWSEGHGRLASLQLGLAQRAWLLVVHLHADVGCFRVVLGMPIR